MTQQANFSRLIATLVIFLSTFTTYMCAQQLPGAACGMVETTQPLPVGGGGGCQSFWSSNPWWSSYLHRPFPEGDASLFPSQFGNARFSATKVIRVSIHVWQDDDGNGNYSDLESNDFRLCEVIEHISDLYYHQPAQPSDPVAWMTYLQDGRLTLECTGVFYHRSTIHYNMACDDGQLLTAAAETDPNVPNVPKNTLKLHLIKPSCCIINGSEARGRATGPFSSFVDWGNTQEVVTCSTLDEFVPIVQLQFYEIHWAHEIGHCLGLGHTYGNIEVLPNSDYLDDVFGCPAQDPSWCPSVQCGDITTFCNYATTATDPHLSPSDGFINNVMSNNPDAKSVTSLQLGRAHKYMMNSGLSKYVTGYNPNAFSLAQSEVWDWPMKVYQPIVIPPGRTLTVKCRLEMTPPAKITVMPGARLIIDGGIATIPPFTYERWGGIDIQGGASGFQTSTLNPPYLDNGGYVEIKNGGRVEHAQLGARVQRGAALICPGTANDPAGAFYNCTRAADFEINSDMPQNISRFDFMDFLIDPNYTMVDPSVPPLPHVRMHKVLDIRFLGCTFADDRTGITQSHLLTKGIESLDASFIVSPCPDGTLNCPSAQQYPNVFRGLDHGIHALGGAGSAYFKVLGAVFQNNVCGVYTRGVTGFEVRECNVTVGGNGATDLSQSIDEFYWEGYHRGIFSTNGHGFVIRDNTLTQIVNGAASEGIVVGYTYDSNDAVILNSASGFARAYVGEGIAASTLGNNVWTIGLQFLCNQNAGNTTNIYSRKANGATADEQLSHTIRSYQGSPIFPADNVFDNAGGGPVAGFYDFDRNTTFAGIKYTHRNTGNYVPVNTPTDPALQVYTFYPPNIPSTICQQQYMPVGSFLTPQVAIDALLANKLAYGNSRYIYDQLIDGGSTDEVVQEITDAWPQDAWALRAYLLSKSPYLSVAALKEAMEKVGFPAAMRAEVCIANPEATQKDGFTRWLQEECNQPLPEYLIANIVASWDTKTYRHDMEGTIAMYHAAMTWAANDLLAYYSNTSAGPDLQQMRWVWQQVRTTAARYAEAKLLLAEDRYAEAFAVVQGIPSEHELGPREYDERTRMLAFIDLLGAAHLAQRDEAHLSTQEVQELENLIANANDRSATWINNLLCFNYGICRAPYTGGGEEGAKSLNDNTVVVSNDPLISFAIHPNPANSWVAFDHRFAAEPDRAFIRVKDIVGKPIASFELGLREGQTVWDTRALAQGAYVVELWNAGSLLRTERLIIQ